VPSLILRYTSRKKFVGTPEPQGSARTTSSDIDRKNRLMTRRL
jgi:hypothetical protein